jgi:hypothetical protein
MLGVFHHGWRLCGMALERRWEEEEVVVVVVVVVVGQERAQRRCAANVLWRIASHS